MRRFDFDAVQYHAWAEQRSSLLSETSARAACCAAQICASRLQRELPTTNRVASRQILTIESLEVAKATWVD